MINVFFHAQTEKNNFLLVQKISHLKEIITILQTQGVKTIPENGVEVVAYGLGVAPMCLLNITPL